MKGEEKRHGRESALYQEQLQTYISTYLSQGYTPDQLEKYLKGEGYDATSIRHALKKVNQTYYQGNLELHAPSHHGKFLVIAGLSLLLLSVIVYFFFSTTSFSSYEFYISLEDDEVLAGDNLEFNVATTKEVDVRILVQTNQGNFVLEKQDVFDESSLYSVLLPGDVPVGDYVTDIFVMYKGSEEQYSFSFSVNDEFTQGSQINSASALGNVLASDTSAEELATLTQAINTQNSLACETVTKESYKDECYFAIARDTLDDGACSQINSILKRDNCYLTQVLGGNYITCTLIENAQVREVCESLSSN